MPVNFVVSFSSEYARSVDGEIQVIAEPTRETRNDAEGDNRKRQERALDEALKCTFPASDPVSVEQPTQPAAKPDDVTIELSEVRARQGVTGHNVRYVLGFGLAGAIIALMALYLLY